ncbi:hypothetical protein SAMN05444158_3945 [Bradyrhizobium canariense]|uniref:Uncharacterized protein n=1 Tax=Bradyrhizobium canariense TaxID=255045 RepID=A0A1H1WRQ5_9BRAD|nr:hypothetical protein SAMN05444158_3945 [Bradyrhizobium canariense]
MVIILKDTNDVDFEDDTENQDDIVEDEAPRRQPLPGS